MSEILTRADYEKTLVAMTWRVDWRSRISILLVHDAALRAENERLRELWVAFERYSGVCVGAFLRFGCGSGLHSPKCVGLDTKSAALAQHEAEGEK
jgi:hypothetical protein